MAAFRLSKWYLDCVTAGGEATIAYTGIMRWGPVRLPYSSLIETTASHVTEQHSLRQQHEPHVRDSRLQWHSSALNVTGNWRCDSASLTDTVFSNGNGTVKWECLVPCGQSRIGNREGLGYAERLTMTMPPWKLPLQTLRWGHFLSETELVIWIDWRGSFTNRIVYRNGIRVPAMCIRDDAIEFEDGAHVTLDRSLVIRDGPIGATALSAIPRVRRNLPGKAAADQGMQVAKPRDAATGRTSAC